MFPNNQNRIQTVILAAGKGTRMKQRAEETPKHLLPYEGKAVLHHTLDLVAPLSHEIVLIIGHHGEKIWRYFGDEHQGVPVRYIEQQELKGTAHALHVARHALDNRFLVMLGDNLYAPEDVEKMVEHPWALLAREVENPQNFGVIVCDASGALCEIHEKPKDPPTNLVNCGMYVLGKEFFDHEPVRVPGGEYGLPQTLVKVAKSGIAIPIVRASYWHPVDRPEDLGG